MIQSSYPDPNRTDLAFRDQKEFEEIVEIDKDGNVFPLGGSPQRDAIRPTIIRDPKGEF